jgi:hypothetical protein
VFVCDFVKVVKMAQQEVYGLYCDPMPNLKTHCLMTSM